MADRPRDLLADVTRVVRQADDCFERVGGSSRHWVRDCFLPLLEDAGLSIVRNTAPTDPPRPDLATEAQAREIVDDFSRLAVNDGHVGLLHTEWLQNRIAHALAAQREQGRADERKLGPFVPQTMQQAYEEGRAAGRAEAFVEAGLAVCASCRAAVLRASAARTEPGPTTSR